MSYETNTIQIKGLDKYTSQASNGVIDAIESASHKSGVDFTYLVQQASAESSFNPNAKAKTSSATGLYQFIDSTWLTTIERYGDQYGLETKGKTKTELLSMRKDPKAASLMAAAFASENEKFLNTHWGGKVEATELYFAHFMGASGASSFLNARDEAPLRPAADLFPRAAQANYNVFYDSESGRARTLDEVYQFFDKKFQITDDNGTMYAAKSSVTPESYTRKIAENGVHDYTPHKVSNSIIMQRSQAMRDASEQSIFRETLGFGSLGRSNIHNSLFTKSNIMTQTDIKQSSSQGSPFFSLIAKPVDLMVLTQTMHSKVIRDKS